jgi:DNA-directed RNA polymerase specialized sigma24 family protein
MSSQPTPEEQFSALFSDYQPRVLGFILNKLPWRDRQLAEDLTTETFLSLWRSIIEPGKLIAHRDPFAIMATIAKRRIADHYAVMRNTREVPTDTGHWSCSNRSMAPSGAGYYTPAATGFRTARIGGAA